MSGLADANLVIAAIDEEDALHARAVEHLRQRPALVVPYSVGIELLLIAKRRYESHVEALAATTRWFQLEQESVLFVGAQALDERRVSTVLDAVHLADAVTRGATLHTADKKLLASGFPTTAF